MNYLKRITIFFYITILHLNYTLAQINKPIGVYETQRIELIESTKYSFQKQDFLKPLNIKIDLLFEKELDKQVSSELIEKQYYKIGNSIYALAILGFNITDDCHLCNGRTFICLYEIKNDRLFLLDKTITSLSDGGYGNPASFNKFEVFGKRNLSVSLIGSFSHDGIEFEWEEIYGVHNKKIFNLYSTEKHETYPDKEGFITETVITFIEGRGEFKTLNEVKKKNNKIISNKNLFFNQLKYSHSRQKF